MLPLKVDLHCNLGCTGEWCHNSPTWAYYSTGTNWFNKWYEYTVANCKNSPQQFTSLMVYHFSSDSRISQPPERETNGHKYWESIEKNIGTIPTELPLGVFFLYWGFMLEVGGWGRVHILIEGPIFLLHSNFKDFTSTPHQNKDMLGYKCFWKTWS